MPSLTYAQRSRRHTNPAAKRLLDIIETKKTNLCVSVDVTKKEPLLSIVDAVGPYVCLVKACTSIFFVLPVLIVDRLTLTLSKTSIKT